MREVYPEIQGEFAVADIRLISHKVFVELEDFLLPAIFSPIPMSRKIYRRNLIDIQGFGEYDIPIQPMMLRYAVKVSDFENEYEAASSLTDQVNKPIRYIETTAIGWPATRWDCIKAALRLKYRIHEFITEITYVREYEGDYDDKSAIADFLRRADFSNEKAQAETERNR